VIAENYICTVLYQEVNYASTGIGPSYILPNLDYTGVIAWGN